MQVSANYVALPVCIHGEVSNFQGNGNLNLAHLFYRCPSVHAGLAAFIQSFLALSLRVAVLGTSLFWQSSATGKLSNLSNQKRFVWGHCSLSENFNQIINNFTTMSDDEFILKTGIGSLGGSVGYDNDSEDGDDGFASQERTRSTHQ